MIGNNDVLLVILFTASIGFGALAAIELKSIEAGIRYAVFVFISTALAFAFVRFAIPAIKKLPIDPHVFTVILTVTMLIYSAVSIRSYWYILKYGGRLALVNASILKEIAISIFIIVIVLVFMLFLISKKPDSFIFPGSYLFSVCGAGLSGYIYRFQIRENGFTCWGKLVLFKDIQSMQWENQLYKEKLKITLRSGKIVKVNIPWALILSVDEYARKFQA